MTLKHVPISVGFAIITTCQFALGVWMVTLATMKGGTTKLPHLKDHSHLESLSTPLRLCSYSPTTATYTARRVSLVRVSSA